MLLNLENAGVDEHALSQMDVEEEVWSLWSLQHSKGLNIYIHYSIVIISIISALVLFNNNNNTHNSYTNTSRQPHVSVLSMRRVASAQRSSAVTGLQTAEAFWFSFSYVHSFIFCSSSTETVLATHFRCHSFLWSRGVIAMTIAALSNGELAEAWIWEPVSRKLIGCWRWVPADGVKGKETHGQPHHNVTLTLTLTLTLAAL